jgi:tellurite resistance protein TerC
VPISGRDALQPTVSDTKNRQSRRLFGDGKTLTVDGYCLKNKYPSQWRSATSVPEDRMFFRTIGQVRRFFRILAGFTLLLVGVIMFFTPGPGWLVVFLGLTLLAAEFVWAKRLMERMKHESSRLKDTVLKLSRN